MDDERSRYETMFKVHPEKNENENLKKFKTKKNPTKQEKDDMRNELHNMNAKYRYGVETMAEEELKMWEITFKDGKYGKVSFVNRDDMNDTKIKQALYVEDANKLSGGYGTGSLAVIIKNGKMYGKPKYLDGHNVKSDGTTIKFGGLQHSTLGNWEAVSFAGQIVLKKD